MRNFFISALLLLTTHTASLQAQTVGEIVDEPTQEELALDAASQAALSGPRDVILRDQAIINLQPGLKFIPRKEASDLLLAWGNAANEQLVGLILPINEEENWTLLIEQARDGYVSDEEAKNWNPNDLLDDIKSGADQDNKDRTARGFPEVEILGWKQVPTYDPSHHLLTWALQSRDKAPTQADDISINYNTYALGRDGYFKFNLVTDPASFDHDEAIGQHVLADFEYKQGKAYQDFQAAQDKAATYSIGTLVSGTELAQAQTQSSSADGLWTFIEENARYFALACAFAAAVVYFSGRKK